MGYWSSVLQYVELVTINKEGDMMQFDEEDSCSLDKEGKRGC